MNPRTGVRGPSLFKLEWWNHYDAIVNDSGEITNNKSESFNSQMKLTIPKASNIIGILKSIQDEDAISQGKFNAALIGNVTNDSHNKRTKKYLERKERLKKILNQYKTLDLKDYMDALNTFYND